MDSLLAKINSYCFRDVGNVAGGIPSPVTKMKCLPLDRGAPKEEMSPGASNMGEPPNLRPKSLLFEHCQVPGTSSLCVVDQPCPTSPCTYHLLTKARHHPSSVSSSITSTIQYSPYLWPLPHMHSGRTLLKYTNWFRELILEIELL